MKSILANTLKYTLVFGLAIGLTYWALKDIAFADIVETWDNANKLPIFLSGVAVMLSHFLRALRWKLLMKPLGCHFSVFNSYLSILVGYGVNIVVPRGGELARCINLNKLEGTPVKTSVGTVISERLVDLMFLILMIGIAFLLQFNDLLATIVEYKNIPKGEDAGKSLVAILFVVTLPILFVIALYLFFKSKNKKVFRIRIKLKNLFLGIYEGLKSIFKLEQYILFLVYSVLIWGLYYLMAYFVIFAFEETRELGFEGALMVLVLGSIAMAMPTPGGTGAYHNFVPFGLETLYQIPSKAGKAFATIFHAWQTIVHLVIGILSIIISQILIQKNAKHSK